MLQVRILLPGHVGKVVRFKDAQGPEAPALERAVPPARRHETGEMLLRPAASAIAVAVALLAPPASAGATVSCVRAGDELQVTANAPGDNMTVGASWAG